jgi:dipeptidyl aminopeptidase/acylaminoacyl peptidase
MKKTAKAFDVDALWALDRIGEPSLAPDGAQAVAGVTRYSMETNKAQASLWLFSTLGGVPRRVHGQA